MYARMLLLCAWLVTTVAVRPASCRSHSHENKNPHLINNNDNNKVLDVSEFEASFWMDEAQDSLQQRLLQRTNTGAAKNVIMFLGDGMSVTTLAAARALQGQREGRTGEEASLAFEDFPVVGLAKTYCVDAQIADSACTATAYLCGVKARRGTLGLSGRVARRQCSADVGDHAASIAAWALQRGRDVGLVTTTRVTHASPAGLYAHVSERSWEDDAEVLADGCDADQVHDIAYQLVNQYPGNQFKVVLGGGRREFLPNGTDDGYGNAGKRSDGGDLISSWLDTHQESSPAYVSNRSALLELNLTETSHLLGLFESSHLKYHLQADPDVQPSLQELTEVAIRMLQKNTDGFFLFVEGGRIDHGHHDNLVHLALDETLEFSAAVARARELTSEEDTLIVVTSDHAHVMTFNGYSPRGHDVLGPSADTGDDGVPYMTLSYANGPGFRPHAAPGVREDVTQYNYRELTFPYPAEVPLVEETHGGEDVAVFALGPQQHMFTGLYEQNEIPHLMAYAACLGDGVVADSCQL